MQVKGCTNNFPLILRATSVEQDSTEPNFDFLIHLLPSMDYTALHQVITKDVKLTLFMIIRLIIVLSSESQKLFFKSTENFSHCSIWSKLQLGIDAKDMAEPSKLPLSLKQDEHSDILNAIHKYAIDVSDEKFMILFFLNLFADKHK